MTITKRPNRPVGLFLILYQIILGITLPFYLYYYPPSWQILVAGFVVLYLGGLGITAGYHRLFSHRAYKTNKVIEAIVLFFASTAVQGSCLRWSADHRRHHAFVDTDDDPYCIKKGFWYAHFTWLLEKPRPIDEKVVPDLIKNKMVMFQHKHDIFCMVMSNLIVFLFAGWLCGDYLASFFIVLWTRLFVLHHFTWFINSLAHTWGDRPFDKEQTAVNNFIISFLTFGEGYHNYHHTYANDYRNGVRWYQFDPTKWLIWTLNKLGLAHGLKRVDNYTIQKKMVLERKNIMLNRVKELWYVKKDDLEKKILEISDRLVERMARFNELKKEYTEMKSASSEGDTLQRIQEELKKLQASLKEDYRAWKELSLTIQHLRPLQVQ